MIVVGERRLFDAESEEASNGSGSISADRIVEISARNQSSSVTLRPTVAFDAMGH